MSLTDRVRVYRRIRRDASRRFAFKIARRALDVAYNEDGSIGGIGLYRKQAA